MAAPEGRGGGGGADRVCKVYRAGHDERMAEWSGLQQQVTGVAAGVRLNADKGISMTGIIAGVSATWARIATDSYLSTADGDGSNGMKPFIFSHLAAVIAGRGNDELFWIIAMEATKFDIPFDDLARFLPDLIIHTTLGVLAALALPPDRRASELFLAGWSEAADRPAIHAYDLAPRLEPDRASHHRRAGQKDRHHHRAAPTRREGD